MPEQLILPLSSQELSAIVLSHGWSQLAPLQVALDPPSLLIPYDLPVGQGCITIAGHGNNVCLMISCGDARTGVAVAETCLSLDIDTGILHHHARQSHAWGWIAEKHIGRFLRSPSLFEDCCKIVLAMNTTFHRTIQMSEILVERYGATIGQHRAFPTPSSLLAAGEEALRAETRCGFRARYLLHLAEVAAEQPAIFCGNGWRDLATDDFTALLSGIRGLGPVSVGYIARMYGKPSGFAVDCWVQRRCRELWDVPAETIAAFVETRYATFGPLGPAIFWFDITRHWHDGERLA